jgi:hypothetical protein
MFMQEHGWPMISGVAVALLILASLTVIPFEPFSP